MKKKFETKLAGKESLGCGGFASGGAINPSKWATELYKGEMSGPWLCCYMLRRFGWPNGGSDPYKNLCSWNLTTPMPGLFLCVTPYLGHGGTAKEIEEDIKCGVANLHFAVRFTKAVERKIMDDPGRQHWFKRQEKWLLNWWKKTGSKLYTFGLGKKTGDDDVLMFEYSPDSKNPDHVWGWWKKTPEHAKIPRKNRERWLKETFVLLRLCELIKKLHPKVKLPKMSKWEKDTQVGPHGKKAEAAIKAALADLLRPTNVRDIYFTPFGDIERTPVAVAHYNEKQHPTANYFPGAGHAPEYYFTEATAKERQGED